jgi:RNA polymerase sigma-70 factor (ECF subfamily)
MEDEQIVALYWQRSECAIAETKTKYGNYCNSIAYNILECAEDAQECENDTYLAAWNAMPPHRPNLLSTFLGKLTRRIALDRWKSRRTQKRGGGTVTLSLEELGDCIPDNSTFPDTLEARELAQIITRFLYTLPAQQRLIFLRRYWYCDSIAQVADHCNCSESKVKMSLLRSRNKLSEYLKKEGVFIERP